MTPIDPPLGPFCCQERPLIPLIIWRKNSQRRSLNRGNAGFSNTSGKVISQEQPATTANNSQEQPALAEILAQKLPATVILLENAADDILCD
jgi:hypothetical protein